MALCCGLLTALRPGLDIKTRSWFADIRAMQMQVLAPVIMLGSSPCSWRWWAMLGLGVSIAVRAYRWGWASANPGLGARRRRVDRPRISRREDRLEPFGISNGGACRGAADSHVNMR
jgi:hypothetical protein